MKLLRTVSLLIVGMIMLILPGTLQARDLSSTLALGVSVTPISQYLPENAQLNLQFGFHEDYFAGINVGFTIGEDDAMGVIASGRFGMVFAAVSNVNFYGVAELAFGAFEAQGKTYDRNLDILAVGAGPGFEVFVGERNVLSFFAEYLGMMYFFPKIVFAPMDGLRLGLRFYFDI